MPKKKGAGKKNLKNTQLPIQKPTITVKCLQGNLRKNLKDS